MAAPDVRFISNLLPHLVCMADLELDDALNARWLADIQALREAHPAGREISNSGGWQQGIDDWEPLQPLIDQVSRVSMELLRRYRIPGEGVTLTTMWANINGHRDYNTVHRHAGHLSGVYFVSAAPDAGDLVLGSVAAYCVDNRIVKLARDENGESFLGHAVAPRPKRMVLFSAETNHQVRANLSQAPRVSIAWNAVVTPPPSSAGPS